MPGFRRFRSLFGLDPRRDVEDELAFHLEMRVRELVDRGEPPERARQLALQRFGDYDGSRSACTAIDTRRRRHLLRRELAGDLFKDLRYAGRQWIRTPAFAVAAAGTLALAIAANTTMFAMADAVLFRALPYADADRLMWVASVRTDNPSAPVTLPEYMDYRERNRSLSGLAAYANWSASIAGDSMTERLQGARLSGNAFAILGVDATVGRLLTDADDRADAARSP